MAKYEINDTTLQSYADQIRRITIKEDKIKTIDMPQAIRNLPNPGTNYNHIILPYDKGISSLDGSTPIPNDIDINKITSIYVISGNIMGELSGDDVWKYRVSTKGIHNFYYNSGSWLLKAECTPGNNYNIAYKYYTGINSERRIPFTVVNESGGLTPIVPIYTDEACVIITYST